MYSNVAVTFHDVHRFEDAIRYARSSIQVARQNKNSGGPESLAYGILADALRQTGDLDGALTAVRESRRLEESVRDTSQTWQPYNLALALFREGSILGERGDVSLDRPEEARAVFRQGLDIAEELGRKDPDDIQHLELGGELARRVGDIQRETDPQAALVVYDAAIRGIRAAKNANEEIYRTEASLLAASSYALRALHRDGEAKRRLDDAFEQLRKLGDYPAGSIELGSAADFALRALADAAADGGEFGAAAETYRDLLAKAKGANRDPKDDLRNAVYIADINAALARILRQEKRGEEATALEKARQEIWQQWDRKLPGNAFVQRQLASTQSN